MANWRERLQELWNRYDRRHKLIFFGAIIAAILAFVGISQAELARRIGMSKSNFNQKMKRDTFSNDEMDRIAEALGCLYVVFFQFEDGTKI